MPDCLQRLLEKNPILKMKGGLECLKEFVDKTFANPNRTNKDIRKIYLN